MTKAEIKEMATKIGLADDGTKKQLIDAIDSKAFGLVPAEPLLAT